MREQFPPVNTNLASVNLVGWPGLAVVIIVFAMAMEFLETRWLLLSSAVSGAALAAALVFVRGRHV